MAKRRKIDIRLCQRSSKTLHEEDDEPICSKIEMDFPIASHAKSSKVVKHLPSPVKSKSDKKTYSVIRLPNGLTATIISDTTNKLLAFRTMANEPKDDGGGDLDDSEYGSDVESLESLESEEVDAVPHAEPAEGAGEKLAACGISIHSGSFCDPMEAQGLAHFLEHMVFMGSKKYPKENEFDSFIKRNGGSDNATTECEYTSFYFECPEKHLEKALDIFSQFFISPLLRKEAMARERQAVESEFQIALPSNEHRKQQLLCSTAHVNNPGRKFSWGNQKTLVENITDDALYKTLHEFRKTHYSANRMALAIQARLSEEVLEKLVVKYFSDVPNNNKGPNKFNVKTPFKKEEFHKLYYVESLTDACVLDLTWPLPPVVQRYKTKPDCYLAYLLGNEAHGSLASYLRKQFWAMSLYAGYEDDGLCSNSIYCLFKLTIVLTDLGRAKIEKVLDAIFSYIKMLRQHGPSKAIFDEMQAIAKTEFKYTEEKSASDNVEDISAKMLYYPPEDYLTASNLYFKYDQAEIKSYLDHLTPDSVNVMLSAKTFPSGIHLDKEEIWFRTKYSCVPIPSKWKDAWKNVPLYTDFHLPPKNIFITTNFSLIPIKQITKFPVKVLDTDLIKLWYKGDNKFLMPTAFIGIQIVTPKASKSRYYNTLLQIYMKMLNYLLLEELHPANKAMLEYSALTTEFGLYFTVFGFNQNLKTIMRHIAKKIVTFPLELNEGTFQALKEVKAKQLFNDNLSPQTVARELRLAVLVNNYYTKVDKYNAQVGVTFDALKKFSKIIYKSVQAHCLVQGNMTKEEGIKICKDFVAVVRCTPIKQQLLPKFVVNKLPPGEKCLRVHAFNHRDTNCIVTNYYQFGPGSIKDNISLELFNLIVEEPMFNQLRTHEQLGYNLSCSVRDTYGVYGITFTINSQITKFTVEHVESRLTDFLQGFLKVLKAMPNNEFANAVNTLVDMKNSIDLQLKDEVSRNWEEIKSQDFLFDRNEREKIAARKIKKKELYSLIEKHLVKNVSSFRKITIQVEGFKSGGKHVKGQPQLNIKTEISPGLPKELSYSTVQSSPNHPKGYFIPDLNAFKKQLKQYPFVKPKK